MSPEDGLVREQIDYYNRRATEYDATSTPEGDALESQGLRLEKALRDFRPEGRVLEVACGTGTWTRRLISYADEFTAVDSSADMIRLAKAKVGEAKVRFIEADIFSWHPSQTYDVVFFRQLAVTRPGDQVRGLLVADQRLPGRARQGVFHR